MADMPAKYRNFATEPFVNTKGIEAMTKVANINSAMARETLLAGEWARSVRVMAIEPYNFTQVSWIRPSTFNKDIHWYYYMNQMQSYPTSVMISKSLADACGIKPGYTIDISITGKHIGEERIPDATCFVLGIFDYWPTYYEDYEYADATDHMIIMNFDYVMTLDDTVTYDMWLKKDPDVSSNDIYADWEKRGLTENVVKISDRQSAINAEKSDSLVMALNGLFSMGFISTMIISFMGFLLYWLLSVRKRRLQFGVLRAMGLSKFKLSLMLFWEHMMTSGISVLVGIFIGYLTSVLFLPVLEKTFTTLLPLVLTFNTADNLKVFLLVAVMIISGIVVLSRYISKLKINEAVKIGEE
jgi:putative ABC transport system permease protein